ncbi:N-acyl amino acid synthase FeeM domain-containing protein [Massilia sp. GCM10023247]|uniref:N-acyl amino acid synthase FeeM domain-containing protein n=1 Tax=Massilia sp. GCM10023247 TaxID=3252643 RepID=UPI003623E7C4
MLVVEMPIASFRNPSAPTPGQARPDAAGTRRPGSPAHAAHAGSQVFNVRLAISAERHADAGVLLQRMYAWRGYAVDAGAVGAGKTFTLYAETGGELVGTVSLCLEHQGRLPADEHFGDRLESLRREGRRLCEPSRLAIDKGMSKRVFAALMHTAHLYASRLHACTDYVIEVNPRHVAFYRQVLGFAEFGAQRHCSRVGAPAVLLRLPVDHMSAHIARWAGAPGQERVARSFYPYFFPLHDEAGITARLAALCQAGERP